LKPRTRPIAAALLPLTLMLSAGCASTKRAGAYTPMTEDGRDTAASQRLAQEAVKIVATDPGKAEALLREALNADLYNGPAHNNLGALYLSQGKLYEAAGEFEWARKLMPGHPDPRMNLALVFERAGRTDEALSTYRTALEVYPEHIPTMQAMTRLQLRAGRTDDHLNDQLAEIALRGETPQWREWARLQMAKRAP
jgi:Tfp pilus assembly protein PilF